MRNLIKLVKLIVYVALISNQNAFAALTLSHKMVYTEQLNGQTYEQFIRADHLSVVYFYKTENRGLSNFFKEIEISAAVMTIYDTKFGVIDCTVDESVGKCTEKDSEEQVFIFRHGFLMLQVSIHSMFSVDSIISNVLQVVLLNEAPILQTVEERDQLIVQNRGKSDVVFSYQRALGTYDHRILMEVVFTYQHSYKFGFSNEQKTVENYPHYSSTEGSGVWVLRCKSSTSSDPECPAFKFRGRMERTTLSKFFQALELPRSHDIGRDGDFDPYQESDVDVIYIFYDQKTESQTQDLIREFNNSYLGLMGIITVNVDQVDTMKYELDRNRKLPLLAVKRAKQMNLSFMHAEDLPHDFLVRELNISQPVPVDGEKPMEKTDITNQEQQSESDYDVEADMEKQDDDVAQMAFELRRVPFDRTHLPALTDKTFYSEINDRPFLMVLFYLAFDARNQIVIRMFAKAAELLAKDNIFPLAAVECFDWTDVCGKVNISVYPTVRIYRAAMDPVTYEGHLSAAAFVAAAKLHMIDSPVLLSTLQDVSLIAKGEIPEKINEVTDVGVIGAFGIAHQRYKGTFMMAAKEFQGKYICGIVEDSIADSTCKSYGFNVPCVVVIKRHDRLEPYRQVQLGNSTEDLIRNINLAALLLLPELTMDVFPVYLEMKRPFVILFTSNTDSSLFHLMSAFATDGQSRGMLFTWMNITRKSGGKQSAGEQVLRHFISEPKNEELLVIDHSTGNVYPYADTEISREALGAWLYSINDGQTESLKLSHNEWKPRLAGYDFLKKIDADAARHESQEQDGHSSYIREMNEHGIGMSEETDQPSASPENEQEDLEDEIKEELEQLKHSRLYQEHRTRSTSKSVSPSNSMETGHESMAKETEMKMHKSHSEL